MNPSWHGRVDLGPGRLFYGGRIGTARTHSHHAVQLLIALEGAFVLHDDDGIAHTCRAAVIPADAPHTITGGVDNGLLALFDPDSTAARLLDTGAPWRRDPPPPDSGSSLTEAIKAAVDWLGGNDTPQPRPRHPAVTGAMKLVNARLPAPVKFTDIARAVHISDSRLAHLFRTELGVPFRPYVRWARLGRAVELLAAGRSLTEAAHQAGFTDSAHLNRVFHAMFGSGPTEILRGVQQIHTSLLRLRRTTLAP